MEDRRILNPLMKQFFPSMITEERMLSLRKNTIKNNLILSKIKEIEELNSHSEKNYHIITEELLFNDLSSRNIVTNFYSAGSQEVQIQMAINMIHMSVTDNELKKFGVKQIRNWLHALMKNDNLTIEIISPKISADVVNNLLAFLFQNPQNPKVLYEICYIFIYLTHLTHYCTLLAKQIKNLFDFLQYQQDQIIIKQLLWMISHLIAEERAIQTEITSQCDIVNYVCNVIEANEHNVMSLNSMAFWLFGTFLKGRECIYLVDKKCIVIIPIIGRYIRTQLDRNLFKESLRAIKRFLRLFESSLKNTSLLNMIRMLELPHHLGRYITLKETGMENKKTIMSIFTYLSLLSDIFAEDIVKEEVISHLEDVLRKILTKPNKLSALDGDDKYFNKILRFIKALSSTDMSSSIKNAIVRKTNIISVLIDLKQLLTRKEYKIELMTIFFNLLNADSERIITHLIVIGIPELLIDSLEDFNSPEVLILSLKSIQILIEYGKDIVLGQNFVLVFLESKDCGGRIERLLSHANDEVAIIANQLLKEYFK